MAGAKFSLVKVGLIWVSSLLIALFTILGNTYLPPWAKLAIHVEFMKLELEIDHCQRRVMTRIVIVGLYYKSKIVGFNPDSGIES